MIKPTIDTLDERVRDMREAQALMKQQIEGLSADLKKVHYLRCFLKSYNNSIKNLNEAK